METECCVCLEKLWILKTPCHHHICLGCLIKLRQDQCPLCRSPIISKLPKDVKNFFKLDTHNSINIDDINEFPDLSNHPFF